MAIVADGALARCVGDVEVFESRHWGRTPLLRRAAASGGRVDVFDDVLTSRALDSFFASGIRRPVVRLVQDGAAIPGERYTRRTRLGGSGLEDVVAPDRLADLFVGGATIVAQSLHRTHPRVREFASRLGDEISHRVQANAYLTPPKANGLASHSDAHDVIVLQLEGVKRWSVESLGDFELRPGDTLYVPAGHRHAASSADQTSLHLTLGILRVTYRSVLERLLRAGPPVLDDPLPLRYRTSGTVIESELGEMVAAVQDYLGSLDLTEVDRSERSRGSDRPPRPGALVAAIGLVDLDHSSRVVRATKPWTITRPENAMIRIEADGNWLVAPMPCSAAIARLGDGSVVRVDDLEGLDDDSRLLLTRRVVSAGFCRVVSA